MGERPRAEIDISKFPLVVHTLRFGYGEADIQAGWSVYERLLSGTRRYAIVVVHEPGASVPPAPLRAKLGAWQKAHEEQIKRCNVAVGVVLPSMAHRAAMTALNWLFPPVTPQKACSSLLEAVDFCCDKLVEDGQHLTPAVVSMRADLRKQLGYSTG